MPLDTFSRIRSLLESQGPAKPLQGGAKVIARNRDCFLTERPLKSHHDYERRARHRHTGFDSLSHVPYRPFAELKHTDANGLIANAFGLPFQRADIVQSVSETSKECAKTPSYSNQHTIRVVRDCGKGEWSNVQSRTAGLSAIQLYLNSSIRAKREVAAGAAYHHTLPREEERRSYLVEMRAPKQKRSDNGCHSVHNPSIFLPLLVPTASSKMCLTARALSSELAQSTGQKQDKLFVMEEKEEEEEVTNVCQRVGPNIYVAVAAVHFKMNYGNHNRKKEISPAKRLQMRNCLAKTKAVYSILCCLYNMKMKELKDKRPLTMASIKQLSVKPLPNRETIHHHGHRLGTHMYHTHTSSLHHLQPHRHTSHNDVETWEDLILLSRACTTGRSDTPLQTPLLQPLPASAHTDHHHHLHKTTRVLPPWQRQLVFVDNSENSGAHDPAIVMAECIKGFQSAKDQISEQTKSLLDKRQKNNTHHLEVKARELKLGPNTVSCLRDMRETAYDICRSERTNEKNRPLWYGQLEKEAVSAFELRSAIGTSTEQNTLRAATRWLLERMKYFLSSDIDAVPRVMEKLCLLVMSLPSDQLCLMPVIAAVQFVLEAILEVPAKLCQQWLEMRGVPVTGVSLLQKPVIVFGLTV